MMHLKLKPLPYMGKETAVWQIAGRIRWETTMAKLMVRLAKHTGSDTALILADAHHRTAALYHKELCRKLGL